MISLPCGEETKTMLSRYHRKLERDGQTDGQTDGQNYYITRQCAGAR